MGIARISTDKKLITAVVVAGVLIAALATFASGGKKSSYNGCTYATGTPQATFSPTPRATGTPLARATTSTATPIATAKPKCQPSPTNPSATPKPVKKLKKKAVMKGSKFAYCAHTDRGASTCAKTRRGGVKGYWNYVAYWTFKPLEEGTYTVKITYRNLDENKLTTPANYAYKVSPWATEGGIINPRDFELPAPAKGKKRTFETQIQLPRGIDSFTLDWVNDTFRAGQHDANLSVEKIVLQKAK